MTKTTEENIAHLLQMGARFEAYFNIDVGPPSMFLRFSLRKNKILYSWDAAFDVDSNALAEDIHFIFENAIEAFDRAIEKDAESSPTL